MRLRPFRLKNQNNLHRKWTAVLLTTVAIGLLAFNTGTLSQGWSTTGEIDSTSVSLSVDDFQNIPPLIKEFYLTKLPVPLSDGSNLQMQIEYYEDPAIAAFPPTLPIYLVDTDNPIVFYDDGTHGDSVIGDKNYSTYLTENLDQLTEIIQEKEDYIQSHLPFDYYVGRTVQTINEIVPFDKEGFQNGQTVPVNARIVSNADCNASILKQNSLFITDLSVVEDPARTYNIYANTGNPVGAWTFGTLMKNMANTAVTGVSAKAFLKSWVKHWTEDFVVNNQVEAPLRADVIDHLIKPWLTKALNGNTTTNLCPSTTNPMSSGMDLSNWECIWDDPAYTEANLLKYAPFKLTAIVNRVDLIGNTAYSQNIRNAGETRFIFSLINPVTGQVPIHKNPEPVDRLTGSPNNCPSIATPGNVPPTIDWSGMNVILEYNNTQISRCEIRSFMESWLALSSYPLPTTTVPNSTYNDALELITNTVTSANAMPAAPNGSAIGRIRTNERLFSPSAAVVPIAGLGGNWTQLDWEFRQFEINPSTHLLVQKPLFNTPKDVMMNLVEGGKGIDDDPSFFVPSGTALGDPAIANWIRLNQLRVAIGTHAMPIGISAYLARVSGEFMHYSEIDWVAMNQTFFASNPLPYPNNFRKLRHQYSLQTCQGCHNGESKTFFTHVLPRGYGEPANYWKATPDHFSGAAGLDSHPKENDGVTQLPGGGTVKNMPIPCGLRTFPVVSAFITGRNYGGLNTPSTSTTISPFEDDNSNNTSTPNPNNIIPDPGDAAMNGLYFTNDPFNSCATVRSATNTSVITSTNPAVTQDLQWGHNDLDFRMRKLCQIVSSPCTATEMAAASAAVQSQVFGIMRVANVVSLPRGSH